MFFILLDLHTLRTNSTQRKSRIDNQLFVFFLYLFFISYIITLKWLIEASQIWEMGQEKTNTMDFAEAIDNSDLEAFGFTDDFIFELWGAITDAKAGRLRK